MSIDCNHDDAQLLDSWQTVANGFPENDLVLRCESCRAYIDEAGDILRAVAPREDIIDAIRERTKTAIVWPVSASALPSSTNSHSEEQNASYATETTINRLAPFGSCEVCNEPAAFSLSESAPKRCRAHRTK